MRYFSMVPPQPEKFRTLQMIRGLTRAPLVVRITNPDFSSESEMRVKKINNYRLVGKLGSGASSKVYLGIDDVMGAKYAVKRINLRNLCRCSGGIAQLEREIRLMNMFHHLNILQLKEVLHLRSENEAYLILEYAERGSLGALIEKGYKLSHDSIFSIMKQIAGAIKYLHDQSFVHQDIKPWNILLDNKGRAILADFGIGHSFQSAGMVVGSPAFQAPEALDDEYGEEDLDETCSSWEECPPKEDIWALGVTLYQLLFLRLPYTGSNLYEIVKAVKETPLVIPEGTDEKIAELLKQMLMIDPQKRISIDQLLKNELVANAPDRALDLPRTKTPKEKSGDVLEFKATVCPNGYSFGVAVAAGQRRFSYIGAPYSPESLRQAKIACGKTDESSGDEGVGEPQIGSMKVSCKWNSPLMSSSFP